MIATTSHHGLTAIVTSAQAHAHTLMDMRTDLIAVPHAGLRFHFLRVQVGKPKEEEEVHPAEVPKVISERADDRVTTV